MPQFQQVTPRVPVADLSVTIAFYCDILGFQLDLAWPAGHPTFCILERDNVRVACFEPDGHRPARPTGGCELFFDVHDVHALHAALKDRVPMEWGPEVYFYGRREFAILDPDRYLLIFSEPTDDPPTCPDD